MLDKSLINLSLLFMNIKFRPIYYFWAQSAESKVDCCQNTLRFSGSQLLHRSNTVHSFYCCQIDVTGNPCRSRYLFCWLGEYQMVGLIKHIEEGRRSTGDHTWSWSSAYSSWEESEKGSKEKDKKNPYNPFKNVIFSPFFLNWVYDYS